MRASQTLDRVAITADEDSLIADAGLLLPATLASRLGLAELFDERITAGAHPGDKCLTVISSALAGGDCGSPEIVEGFPMPLLGRARSSRR